MAELGGVDLDDGCIDRGVLHAWLIRACLEKPNETLATDRLGQLRGVRLRVLDGASFEACNFCRQASDFYPAISVTNTSPV